MSNLGVALVGNPNCGKTALFNRLTGARQKVANYAGVTVECKEGMFKTPSGRQIQLLDLPGAYSFDTQSPDELVTRDVLQGKYTHVANPELIVCVVDATNLRLHLRFALEVRAMGKPMVIALNMMDAAKRRGISVDIPALEAAFGVPVIGTIAVKRQGVDQLIQLLETWMPDKISPPAPLKVNNPHHWVRELMAQAVKMPRATAEIDDRLDRLFLHPLWGMLILAAVMLLIFQAVYTWSAPLADLLDSAVSSLGDYATATMPPGPLHDLLVDGILAGIGTVLVFLPPILVLFFFILILEESGYLPRAAFMLDYWMVKVGLTGRAFIPLLSSFSCAIPGVMAARNISDMRDRITTILIAPLMTCSARLPVYALLIGAFIPSQDLWGVFNMQGIMLFVLYFLGIAGAMLVGWIFKLVRKKSEEQVFLMELPSYRLPDPRDLLIGLWERGAIFLKRLTGVILALTVLMWFVSSYPKPSEGSTEPAIDFSIAGRVGHFIEPVFAPLGFNWQISVSLIPAFAARETAVASLATIYSVDESTDENGDTPLGQALAKNFSLASAIALMVWFAFAPQCMSTLAIIKRETGSWKVVALSFGYMFVMAYLAAFLAYRLVLWLQSFAAI